MSNVYFAIRDKKELEFNIDAKSMVFHASKKKSYDNKTQKAIVSVASQLNHFLAYLEDLDDDGGQTSPDLAYFIIKMLDLNDRLQRNKINDVARKRVENYSTRFYDEKIGYFKDVIKEEFVDDRYLVKLISDYIYHSTNKNLEPSDIDEKLLYSDIHVYQCLSLYSKMLYLMYFRVSNLISYDELVKPTLLKLSMTIDTLCQELYRDEYHAIENRSFMDRLFGYIQFQNKNHIIGNERLIDKFKAIGYSEESLAIEILDNVFNSMRSFGLREYKKKSGYKVFNLKDHDFFDWGYIAKATAKYISSVTKRAVYNKFSFTTRFVVHTVAPDTSTGEETPESSKYEIFLEKQDREQYEDLQKLKEYIVEESKDPEVLSKESRREIQELINSKRNIQHQLNKFLVSLFMEQKYSVNVLELLTYEEFLIILFRIYERIEGGYLKLRQAMISKEGPRINGTRFNDEEMSNITFYNGVNSDRCKKLMEQLIRKTYVFVDKRDAEGNEKKIKKTYHVKIKDELLRFIRDGMVI